jgi:hypothetical protein
MGHVATPEPTSVGRQGLELRNVWRCRSSTQQVDEARGHGPRGSTGAHLSKEVRSGAMGHVVAPEPTSAGRCGSKLQLMWQRVDAHPTPYLNLELVCGGIQSLGCRQRPSGPPRERLQTRRWGQFFGARSVILSFYSIVDGAPTINVKTSTVGPSEVPELKVRERPPPT